MARLQPRYSKKKGKKIVSGYAAVFYDPDRYPTRSTSRCELKISGSLATSWWRWRAPIRVASLIRGMTRLPKRASCSRRPSSGM